MTTKPLIGLSGRRSTGRVLGAPYGFQSSPLDIYMSEYATSVIRAGGLPVHLSLDSDPEEIGARLDGLLLSGGADVDPRQYGQAPGAHTGPVEPERDSFEFGLLKVAVARGIPVLGICRGSQLINVAHGGTLVQHLEVGDGESHASVAYPRDHRGHEVRFEPGSTMAELYGPSLRVNSFHHQAVERPGDGITVTGRATDGIAEAIEVTGVPVLGVQWHPECFGGDPIFDWLVTASTTKRRP